jgi:lipopolysaccharide/colanic/teichoic acid biosynthesis glycosyltransferase
MYKNYTKRIFDILIALFLLVILHPIIIFTFSLLFIANKGRVFFFQFRPGYKGVPFVIFKFRTMRDAYDSEGNLLADEKRLTQIGKLVRIFSFDELLQLVNVLKGDMSLVGPRPLLTKYLTRYNLEQFNRHNVRPGITGWAQVNGRNSLTWEEKFKLDLEYVEKISFTLDIKILLMTVTNVLKRKGISSDGHVTMEEFMGSKQT